MKTIKKNLNILKIFAIVLGLVCIPLLIVWTSALLKEEYKATYLFFWNYAVKLVPILICLMIMIIAEYIKNINNNYRINIYVIIFLVTGLLLITKNNVSLVVFEIETSLFAKFKILMVSNVELLVLSLGLLFLDNEYLGKVMNQYHQMTIEIGLLLFIFFMGLSFVLSVIINNLTNQIIVTVLVCLVSLSCVYSYLIKNKYKKQTRYTINVILGYAFIAFSRIMLLFEPIKASYVFLPNAYEAIGFIILLRKFLFISIGSFYVEINDYRKKTEQEMSELKDSMANTTREIKEANIKLLKNLDDAKNIQQALIEREAPRFNEIEFAYRYIPCEQVGGDFYQIIKLDERRVGIFFGDVSGHGVSSAMINVFISQNVRFKMEYENGHTQIFRPRGVLSYLYHLYNTKSLPEETYAVSCYGIYDIDNQIFEYSSAGLNVKPVLLKKDGNTIPLEMSGFPICSFDQDYKPNYETFKIKIEQGESLIFYSDGLTEIDRKRPDLFSEQILLNFLSKRNSDSAEVLTNTLINKYYELRGKRKILDDVTILTMKVKED